MHHLGTTYNRLFRPKLQLCIECADSGSMRGYSKCRKHPQNMLMADVRCALCQMWATHGLCGYVASLLGRWAAAWGNERNVPWCRLVQRDRSKAQKKAKITPRKGGGKGFS